jgi:hypothetical protein
MVMVRVECECGQRYRLGEEAQGRRVRCRECGALIRVPLLTAKETLFNKRPRSSGLTDSRNQDGRINIHVSFDKNVDRTDQREVARRIRQAILEHVQSAPRHTFEEIDLEIEVVRFSVHPTAKVQFQIEGFANQIAIQRKIKAHRNPAVSHGAFAGGLAGALLAIMINTVVHTIRSTVESAVGDEPIEQCLSECLASVKWELDRAVGRDDSDGAWLWQSMVYVRWILAVLAWIGFSLFIVKALGGQRADWFLGVLMGLILGAVVWFLMYAVTLLAVPASFLLHDPRGQRAMARSGVSSVITTRILAATVAVVLLGVLIWLSLFVLFREDGKAPQNQVQFKANNERLNGSPIAGSEFQPAG